RRVRGRGDDEIDVAGADLLQHLRLLAELRARELIDDHGSPAELLQLRGEGVARESVGRAVRLVIAEGVMLLGVSGGCGERQARERQDAAKKPGSIAPHEILPSFAPSPGRRACRIVVSDQLYWAVMPRASGECAAEVAVAAPRCGLGAPARARYHRS